MEPLSVLSNLRMAAPCKASWDDMRGDGRVRFCEACAKHVYNVSDLTAVEAVDLIQEHEGHVCMRLYRRRDGTVLTADCPVGLRAAVRRRVLRLATQGVVLIVALQSGIWVFANAKPRVSALPPVRTGPGVTFSDWTNWAAEALGLRPRYSRMTVGKICLPAVPSNPPPADPEA
jgi:hypothetical protein